MFCTSIYPETDQLWYCTYFSVLYIILYGAKYKLYRAKYKLYDIKPSSHDELFKIDKTATTTNIQIVPNIEKYPSI